MPAYPVAPWRMHGQLWCSLFRVPRSSDQPAGTYGVALVRYEQPSPLTYAELLVAHAVSSPVRGVSIDQIWVDSPASMAGGRELWAIPKKLCDFQQSSPGSGRVDRASWAASVDGSPVLSASFADVSRVAPRVPFRGATWQPGIAERGETTARLTGSSRTLPCRARWTFDPAGPLAWLRAGRQLASFRMVDLEMEFA